MPCPRQLRLPVAPPVVLYGGRVQEGHLCVKFLRVKTRPWETATKCVQVRVPLNRSVLRGVSALLQWVFLLLCK